MRSRPAVQRASLHWGPDACLEPSRLDWTSQFTRGVADPLSIESFIERWHRQGEQRRWKRGRAEQLGRRETGASFGALRELHLYPPLRITSGKDYQDMHSVILRYLCSHFASLLDRGNQPPFIRN